MRKRLKRAAKALAVVTLALFIVWSVATLYLAHLVSRELARIRAEGMPVTAADLVPKKIPDAENAAVVYAKAFRHLGGKNFHDTAAAAWSLAPGPSPEENPSDAELKAIMKRWEPYVIMLEEGARRPSCQFNVRWKDGVLAHFAYPGQLRAYRDLLGARAKLNARHGNTEEALRSIRLMLALSESLKARPTNHLSQWTRASLIGCAADSTRYLLQHCRLTEEQADSLRQALARIDLGAEYGPSLVTDRVWAIQMFGISRHTTHDDYVASFCEPCLIDGPNEWRFHSPNRFVGTWLWLPFSYSDELCYLSHMRRQLRLVDKPYRGFSALERQPGDPGFPWYAYVARNCAVTAHEVQLRRDLCITDLTFAETSLALDAYRTRFGSYPQSLKELQSSLGIRLRKDPFSGHDVGYIRRRNAFTLYSIGPNLRDDKGRECKYPMAPHSSGDIVWLSDEPEPPIPPPSKKPTMGPMAPGPPSGMPAGPSRP